MLSTALEDLGIDSEEDGISELIRAETEWIKRLDHEGDIQVQWSDVINSWARINSRIMNLWREAESRRATSLPAPGIDWAPTYSVFISYSHQDEEFAKALFNDLELHGLRVWYALDSVRAGEKLTVQLTRGIEHYDKLLLVLSENSISSEWIQYEIRTALEMARSRGLNPLVPIRLTSIEAFEKWRSIDPKTGTDLAEEVRGYFIPDFSKWRDPDVFSDCVNQLVASLRRRDKEEVASNDQPPDTYTK